MRIRFNLNRTANWHENLMFLASLLIISGGTIYYLYALNWPGVIAALILTIVGFILLRRDQTGNKNSEPDQKIDQKNYRLLGAYGLSCLALIIVLIACRSDRALISPWQVVNYIFFWLYGLASLFLILILKKEELSTNLKISLLSAHYFISGAVALIIYKIAYGFDPFVHQATMELIAAKGLVLPKPPYYLGEYGLIVIIHKISGISIAFLNKILVPFLSACLLPPVLYRFLSLTDNDKTENKTTREKGQTFLTVLFLLIIGSSLFTLTTPQNLSYLFLILTILAGLSRISLPRVGLLALATAVIHPLTGLPALSWVAWLIFKKYRERLSDGARKIGSIIIWLFVSLALPLALIWAGGGSLKKITISWSSFLGPFKNLGGLPGSAGREGWLLNTVYFLAANYNIILILAIVASLIFFYKKSRRDDKKETTAGLIFINSGLLVAYFLSAQIYFTGLIDYEQAAYAQRIPIIITIFFLPFLLIGLKRLITKIQNEEKLEQGLWLIFGLGLLVASLYLSYPRFDKYWNSRGYSTSASDLAAVKAIDHDARPDNYLVLANQQVSVAALAEFGFDHYYKTSAGPLYFYPIPTGGPLYQYYLDMVYKNPGRANLEGACALTGVKKIYLVINKYWYQSGRLINEAKLNADQWWTINNEVYIFKYRCQI